MFCFFDDLMDTERWQASWWMVPAWPVTLLVSVWFMFIAPLLSGPFLLVDRFELKGVANQVRGAKARPIR